MVEKHSIESRRDERDRRRHWRNQNRYAEESAVSGLQFAALLESGGPDGDEDEDEALVGFAVTLLAACGGDMTGTTARGRITARGKRALEALPTVSRD